MLSERNPLLTIELKKKKFIILKLIINVFESFYSLFDLLLENAIENIWFECFNILLGYFQIIIYIFEETVSLFY